MKKVFYIILVSFVCGGSLISCTEEQVSPKTEDSGGNSSGGTGEDPIKKG